jgi:hypothetical protein
MNYDIKFNDTIRRQILRQLRLLESACTEEKDDDALLRKASKTKLLGAIGAASGLPAMPQVKELADAKLLAGCDPSVLSQGMFTPLRSAEGQLLLAVANPWDYRADEFCNAHFADHEIFKVVTLASEISATIERSTQSSGPPS